MSEAKQLKDEDYILAEGSAWFDVKGFSIRVHTADEGVIVDIFKSGAELDGPVASTYAFDSEIEEGESK